jgi:ATP-binding cassette subfamily B protein
MSDKSGEKIHSNRFNMLKSSWSLLRNYKRQLVLGIISLIIVDIADIIPPILIKLALDNIEKGTNLTFLAKIGAGLISAAIIQGTFRFFWRRFFLGTSHKAVYDLRKQLFLHLLKLPFPFFNKTRTGDLMSRLTNDLQEIRMAFGIGLLISLDATFYLMTVPLIMFYLSPKLTLIIFAPLIVLPLIVIKFKKSILTASTRVQERTSDLSAQAEENISGIKVIKGFNTEKFQEEKFSQTGARFLKDKLELAFLEAIFHPSLDMLMSVCVFLLLLFGGEMVIAKTMTLGSFFAFQAYLFKLAWPMMAIGWVLNLFQRSKASMIRCREILDEAPAEHQAETSERIIPENSELKVESLSYTFPDAENPALDDISFELREGQTLGITGPIGCGKTTLLRLLMRIIEPQSGQITIGNVSSQEMKLATLRSLFSYVPQDSFLFSENIGENILFSQEDKSDTDKAMAFAQIAGVKKDILEFPEGINTLLGERGVNLSGGQKQRVSLARALASESPILILDDCTSAVDTSTEKKIIEQLNSEAKKRTRIIVSHRLVSLQDSDQIIYLVNGKIKEKGTHADLLNMGGEYAATWEKQRIEEMISKN